MRLRSAIRVALTGLMLAMPVLPASAQKLVDRVAAVVNDEVVTIQDVEDRYRMALTLSQLQDSQETRRRLIPQVVRKIIDERLQMQEAARLKISMTPAEVETGIAAIEQRNRQPRGALIAELSRAGVPAQAIREQVRADFTWIRVVQRTLRSQVKVGDEEVKDRLATIQARTGQPEFLAAEIFLPVENPGQDEDVATLADRLLQQLKAGTPFGAVANQFSRAATAASGGQMGWVARGMVDDEIVDELERLQPGQVSKPIRVSDGYRIVALLNRRIAGAAADPEKAMITLGRIVLPVPKDGPSPQQLLQRAHELTRSARSCDDLEAIGRRLAAPIVERMPPRALGEFEDGLRQMVAMLPPGVASSPMPAPEGITVAMVCDRKESTVVQLPSEEEIRRQIEEERLDMLARRYLRDLRRAAFVDIRM